LGRGPHARLEVNESCKTWWAASIAALARASSVGSMLFPVEYIGCRKISGT